jgi:hypothetical protein
MEAGFYREVDGVLQYAPSYVEGNGYILLKELKDTYTYPIDGWEWREENNEN